MASNAASLQQAIWFTQSSAGLSTVTAPFGTSTSLGWRAVNPLAGQLRGTLESGEAMLVSFTQGGPGRIQIFGPAVPTAGETLLGVAAALALAGSLALRARCANAGLA